MIKLKRLWEVVIEDNPVAGQYKEIAKELEKLRVKGIGLGLVQITFIKNKKQVVEKIPIILNNGQWMTPADGQHRRNLIRTFLDLKLEEN